MPLVTAAVHLVQEHALVQPATESGFGAAGKGLVRAWELVGARPPDPCRVAAPLGRLDGPMERARSVFETPARFGLATLNGLTPPHPLGATGWRPIPRQPLFLFPQLDS